ncbi:MAG: alpha/beta fold hydrolase [Candidatus Thorarchaeota archaeon]
MSIDGFDKIYGNVISLQKELLRYFRYTHEQKTISVNEKTWNYFTSGFGKETILFLPGGTRTGESFAIYPYLENDFKIIAPTYPIVRTISELVDGINGILENERISSVNLLGTSLGGMISQVFVRKYAEKIKKMIIANTMPPSPEYNKRTKNTIQLLKIMPNYIIRNLTRKSLGNIWKEADETEKEFWQAYLKELLINHLSKAWIITQFSLSYDYSINYSFNPNDLAYWKGDMLIIYSDKDDTFDLTIQSRLLDLYPNAKSKIFMNSGHTPALSNKEEYIQTIIDFFSGEI